MAVLVDQHMERDLERSGAVESPELDIRAAQRRIRTFVEAREWGQFHTPLTLEESASVMTDPELATPVSEELADIVYYVLRLADAFP